MRKYNDELVKAGVMQSGEGLHPSAKGKRVRFSGKDRTVTDGPFAETKELVSGFKSSRSTTPSRGSRRRHSTAAQSSRSAPSSRWQTSATR